jgi:hypothetical protein
LLWYCLILSVAKGENLVKTRLDFAWFLLDFMCGEGRKPRSDSPWLCLFLRLFAVVLLDFMCGEGRKPRSGLAWFCLFLCFFAIGKLDIAMVDGRGEDKTSFGIGLVLLDFCYFLYWLSCYRIVWWRGISYSYRSLLLSYWSSRYRMVSLLQSRVIVLAVFLW